MNSQLKYLIIFILDGLIYCGVEIAFRGYTHWTMFILGGICGIFADYQNEVVPWDFPLWKQTLNTWIFVVVSEFIAGVILNISLGLSIWDYSNIPGNILGQVSAFDLLFLPLCTIAIVSDDYIRYWLFKEEKPRYKWK